MCRSDGAHRARGLGGIMMRSPAARDPRKPRIFETAAAACSADAGRCGARASDCRRSRRAFSFERDGFWGDCGDRRQDQAEYLELHAFVSGDGVRRSCRWRARSRKLAARNIAKSRWMAKAMLGAPGRSDRRARSADDGRHQYVFRVVGGARSRIEGGAVGPRRRRTICGLPNVSECAAARTADSDRVVCAGTVSPRAGADFACD